MRGKLATVIDQIEHGHHVFRAYFKHAFLKQYEKFSTFLRNELCSNNLTDFGLRKGLDHLDEVRQTFQTITSRFAGYQAQWLNVHVDFPLLQRIALPITVGSVRYPGTKIHDVRVIRLFEVLLHGGAHVGGWTAKQIHQAVLTTFQHERCQGIHCQGAGMPLGSRAAARRPVDVGIVDNRVHAAESGYLRGERLSPRPKITPFDGYLAGNLSPIGRALIVAQP